VTLASLAALLSVPSGGPSIVSDAVDIDASKGLSTDRKHGITYSQDGTVRLWELPPGRRVDAGLIGACRPSLAPAVVGGWPQHVYVCMNVDGSLFALGTGGHIQIWQSTPPRQLRALEVGSSLTHLEWAPHRSILLANHSDGRGVGETSVLMLSGELRRLPIGWPWAFTPKEDAVLGPVKGGFDLVQIATGAVVRRLRDKLEMFPPEAISRDGAYAVLGGEDQQFHSSMGDYVHRRRLNIFRLRDGKKVASLPGFRSNDEGALEFVSASKFLAPGLGQVVACPSGHVLASFKAQNRYAEAWMLTNPMPGRSARSAELPKATFLSLNLAMSTDGSRFAVVSGLYEAYLEEFSTMPLRLVGRYAFPPRFRGGFLRYTTEGVPEVSTFFDSVSLNGGRLEREAPGATPNGERLLVASSDGSKLVLGPRGATRTEFPSKGWEVGFAKSADGNRELAAALELRGPNGPKELRLLDSATGRAIWSNDRYRFWANPSMSSDCRVVVLLADDDASSQRDAIVVILDGKSGQELDRFPAPTNTRDLAIYPDGSRIVALQWIGTTVFDRLSRRPLFEVPEVRAVVNQSLHFTPSGKRVILLTGVDQLAVLDPANGQILARLQRFGAGDWAAWTTSGAVTGTPAGIKHLFWVGDKLRQVTEPREPDVVSQAFAG